LSFSYSDYVDLGDFTKKVQSLNLAAVKTELLTDVQNKIRDVVITTDNGDAYQSATGMSIWIPVAANKNQARYDRLQFSRDTGWNNITTKLAK